MQTAGQQPTSTGIERAATGLNCDSLSGAELESFRLPLSSRRLNTRCHQWLVRRWLVLRIMAEQTG
jgi:hypothetical protein